MERHNTITTSGNSNDNTNDNSNDNSSYKEPVKKGRKPKYNSDEERLEARRLANKLYRQRQRVKILKYNELMSKTHE